MHTIYPKLERKKTAKYDGEFQPISIELNFLDNFDFVKELGVFSKMLLYLILAIMDA